MGRIKLFGVSPAWQKVCPAANFCVKYSKKETDNALDGDSALGYLETRVRAIVYVSEGLAPKI